MPETTYDIVIVGSGAGGGFAAMELTRQGLKVLLIERGRRYLPADFPMIHDNWERQPDQLRFTTLTDESVVHEAGAVIPAANRHLTNRRLDVAPVDKATRRSLFKYQRVHAVGGSTLHYEGEAHRFAEHAFEPRSLFGWGQDWPVGYQELAPFYDEAEAILGVAGNVDNPFKPDRGLFPTPAHKLSTKSQWAGKAAEILGWQLQPNTLALPSQSIDGRLPCQHSGGCVRGCIFGAKSSVDVTAIMHAEKTGNLTLLENTRLLSIQADKFSRITSIRLTHDNRIRQISAAHYIFAMGAIETPRMLLASVDQHHPRGIGNETEQVGHYLMETLFTAISAQARQPLQAWKGQPLDNKIWDFCRPDQQQGIDLGFTLSISGVLLDQYAGPMRHALSIPGFRKRHKQAVRSQFGSMVQFIAVAEQEPVYENHISLSEKKDKLGIPKVHAHIDYSRRDLKVLERMILTSKTWATVSGVMPGMKLYSSYSRPSATHVAGTCRMGNDPQTSVVDRFGKIHSLSNASITDGSVLPTQGAGDAPSLTIQALALRTARHIAENG